jgi:hypothetical protein
MNSFTNRLGISLILLAVCAPPAFGQFRESIFKGAQTMTTKLKRKKPPQVYLMAETINVRVVSQTPRGNSYAPQIESMLETALLNNYRHMRAEARNPEALITCQITRVDSKEDWEQRTNKESQKVGERREWNDKKKQYETKPEYKDVNVTKRYKIVNASVNLSFQVKDMKKNQNLDADNIFTTFKEDYLEGNGAPSPVDLEQTLVRRIVEQITPRIAPTFEEIEVMLPVGDWKSVSRSGQTRLWGRMRDTLEKMEDPKRKPKDDAYRYFGIGLAYEALAYEAEDLQQTRKLLDDAAFNYSKAIELNMEEKYFLSPQKRIDDAIMQYRKLVDQQAEFAKAKGLPTASGSQPAGAKASSPVAPTPTPTAVPAAPTPPPASTTSAGAKSTQAMTNQDVIELAKKGLAEDELIATIKEAPAVQFDLGPQAKIALLENMVPSKVITAMRLRHEATRRPANTPRKKTRP